MISEETQRYVVVDFQGDPKLILPEGASRRTHNLSSAMWATYAPNGKLVSLQKIYLCHSTNNITEYSVMIELLSDFISCGIHHLVVKLIHKL